MATTGSTASAPVDGVRAEVFIESPGTCPVAAASAETGREVADVSWTTVDDDGTVVEEFGVDRDVDVGGVDAEPVYDRDGDRVYRFERDRSMDCPCEHIEALGVPVADVYARDGDLCMAFHAPDVGTVDDVVADLRDQFDGVRLGSVTRQTQQERGDLVVLDRDDLTARQREVLSTAREMGYFEYPKGANASEVADALDIAPSTFAEHLAAAQSKVMATLCRE
jgi:hypothetical protein